VVNDATGEGLKGVKLTLKRTVGGTAFTTETGEGGTYALQGLDPGMYTLAAERPGFLPLNYGAKRSGQNGSALSLAVGQSLTGIDLKLQPYGVISGRVLDPDGDPMLSASVTAMRVTYVNGQKQLKAAELAARTPPLTNDLGEYRIFGLNPGTYYIRAAPRGPDGSPVNFVATFYPNTAELRSAAALEVTAGKVVAGADVKLVSLPAVSVRGQVNNQTGATGGISVLLFPDVLGTASGSVPVKADGKFELTGVVPGRYWLLARLIATSGTPSGDAYQTKQLVDVTGRAIEGLEMTLDKGVSVNAHVTVEPGGDAIRSLRSIRASLQPSEVSSIQRLFATPSAQLEEDGTLRLNNVPRGQYDLSFMGLPNGYYIKSARSGDLDLRENSLNLTGSSTEELEIVLSGKAGAVAGSVKDTPGATVVLIPEGLNRRQRSNWYRTTTADRSGKFVLNGITPGDYKLFAWDDIEDGAWMDPDVIDKVENRGAQITVREGGSETLDLTVIP